MKKEKNVLDFLETGEDFPVAPVPLNARKSWVSIGMVWTGVFISIAGILDGLSVVGALPFYEGLLALAIGFIIFSTMAVLQGSIGTKTGLSTYMIAKFSFGSKGSHVVSLVSFLGSFGWYIIQCRALAESFISLTGFGNIQVASVFFGLLMMVTAILGYRGIEALSKPTVIYTFFFMIIATINGLMKSTSNFEQLVALAPLSKPLSFSATVSVVVGAMAIGVVISPDIMRFSRSTSDNIKALFIIGLPFSIIQPVSAMILGLLSNSSNFSIVMITMGGIFGLIMVLTGAWTSNDNNLYSASLAMSEMTKNKYKRWKISVTLGVLASFISGFFDLSMYQEVMFFICAFVIPVAGICIADFYILPKMGLKSGIVQELDIPININAIISWVFGGLLQASFDYSKIRPILGIPGVVITIITSMIIYIVLMKLKYKSK